MERIDIARSILSGKFVTCLGYALLTTHISSTTVDKES